MKTAPDIYAAYPWQIIVDWAAMVRAYFSAMFGAPAPICTGVSAECPGPYLAYAYEWQGKARGSQLILTTPAFAPHIGFCANNRGVAVSEQMRCPYRTRRACGP